MVQCLQKAHVPLYWEKQLRNKELPSSAQHYMENYDFTSLGGAVGNAAAVLVFLRGSMDLGLGGHFGGPWTWDLGDILGIHGLGLGGHFGGSMDLGLGGHFGGPWTRRAKSVIVYC